MKTLQDFQGNSIRLTDERLRHILEHPEMADMENAVAQTLAQPERVIRSKTDDAVALNYRFYLGTKVGDKWLCVVVKYLVADALVITAYLTDQIKKGEQIWPST